MLVDDRSQIDALKFAPIVTLIVLLSLVIGLKEKYASKVEELDVLMVELDEMKSRPFLLGACTSCPVLHAKLYESHAYARSLEAELKAPIPTSCSTCEIHVVKNLELAHYVDCLQDDNDLLRKMMGWLSGREPQLRMMIEAYKRYDGQTLGSDKIDECSGEEEKIGDTPALPKTFHKNAFAPKLNPLRNRLDTTPDPPVFPSQTNNFQKPIKFKSDLGNDFFGKKGEKPSKEKPQPRENPKLKPKLIPFHCDHSGRDGHLDEFCFRRKCEERFAREMASNDSYRPSRGMPESRVMPRGKGTVHTIYLRESMSLLHGVCLLREIVVGMLGLGVLSLMDVPSPMANTSMGGTIEALGLKGAMDHSRHLVVLVVLWGRVGVPSRIDRRILLTLLLRKWHDTSLIPFTLTLVLIRLLTLTLIFYFVGGRHGGLLVDRLWLLSTHDRKLKEYITFGNNGKGRVLSVGTVKVRA
jgi:hypothetical protein